MQRAWRRAGGRRGPRARRADDVHAVGRACLPALRRRGQGRAADADPGRPARADGGVRGRGHRPADPDPRLRGAHRRPGRDQRHQRDHHRALQRLPRGGARRPGARLPLGLGQPAGVRPPRAARPDHQAGLDRARHGRGRPVGRRGVPAGRGPAPRARCSWTSAWRRCSARAEVPAAAARAGAAAAGGRAQDGRARRRQPSPRSPRCSPAPSRPVLVLGSDVWLDGADRGRPRRRRGTAAAGDRQRPGPRHPARRARPAGHQGPVGRLRRGRPGASWPGRRWTSGWATASSAAGTGRPPAQVVHVADAAGQLATHRQLAASAAGDLAAFFTGLAATASRPGPEPAPGPGTGCPSCRRPRAGRRRRRRAAGTATPTRSTRCGSTASWAGCWTTTRW